MAKKTIYRTVIELEILSEEPIDESMSLADIDEECESGSFSGKHEIKIFNSKLTGKKAVVAITAQGSRPDFFGMDEDGNNIEDNYYE